MSQMNPDDKDNTIELLKRNSAAADNKTWLRHKADGESGQIDLMVLKGCYTINQMINLLSEDPNLKPKTESQWEKRIKDHLTHLGTTEGDSRNRASGQGGHNLPLVEGPDGAIRFNL